MAELKSILSPEEIRERLRPLQSVEGLQLIMLFGSVAAGSMHKRSDIDLAFLFDMQVDILELTNKVIRLLRTDDIDVVDLNRASPLLKFIVAKQGTLLYEKTEGVFNRFYSLAFRRYVDTRKLRDAQTAVVKQFLKTRGLA
ncbi:MAG: type VII toxin-antitoxin system MntA family adenylyltransferase antitoxin [Nitrospirota bacterium]